MFIILITALSLVLYFSIDKGLKPLQRLSLQINRRSGNNLEYIENDCNYSEIVTIKNALNRLLHRLKQTLAREKRITSDAAHELRTPLAAIRLHTELAKSAKNREQKNASLDQVIQGVDRTTHLVEQLLALARLEPAWLVEKFVEVNISALIAEECALLSPLAMNKEIDLFYENNLNELIYGHDASLRLLLRNLLTNAVLYTPEGGKVVVSVAKEGEKAVLVVEDNGPGILEKDRERVMERFYRAENHQVPGCGIGLSIVDRVVQMHQGTLQLSQADRGQGLKVIVHLFLQRPDEPCVR